MKLKGGLYHQTQVRLAYNSNHMEGSRLTEEQTRSIYETDSFVVKEWFAVGDYKKRPKMIGDMVETTHPSKVASEMKQLLKEYRECSNITFEDIIDFHYKFEKIHPFQDGNGRVGRLVMFKECLKYNIPPFIIEDASKDYYRKGFLVETCRASQDAYKKLLEYFE